MCGGAPFGTVSASESTAGWQDIWGGRVLVIAVWVRGAGV
jgi:hypothetical protein